MITFEDGIWRAQTDIKSGTIVIDELPALQCPAEVPTAWKKLAKKISKLEPDRKADDIQDTMPPWVTVSLNEAIIRLLYAFDVAPESLKSSILSMYDSRDDSEDTPFESLIRKAKQVVLKEASKIGMGKATIGCLHEILRVLTTKVCVTTDGGAVLFGQLGRIPHSCTPCCMFIPRENRGQLIAIRDIEAGERINCSHIPTNCLRASTETRQSWLRGVAGTRCRSDCCTTGFDLRRRVICVKCHPADSRGSLSTSDQSDLCFSAHNQETGHWVGLKCGAVMPESEAIDIAKEKALMKKIMILNETDVELPRLFQFTKNAIQDAILSVGKGHFCYQQLLLLECGLALHTLCQQISVVTTIAESQRKLFVSWIKMLVDIHNFSVQTDLPFDGMDELVRIVLAPETLQSTIKMIGSIKRWKADESFTVALTLFDKFVTDSCKCLVFIEGETSVHSTDGIKLKNWWTKKYKQWLTEPEVADPEEPVIVPVPPAVEKSAKVKVSTSREFLRRNALPIAVGARAIVAVSILIARRLRSK